MFNLRKKNQLLIW